MASSGLTVIWFLGIVALIPLTLWLLKRSGLATGAVGGGQGLIKPVGQFNIGPGQRLVTVEVGTGEDRTWLVLGVTGQHISALHTMAPQASAAGEVTPVNFTSLLRRSMGQQDKGQA